MPSPRLIHPVAVEIEQIDRDNIAIDPDFREEIENIARKPVVTVPGQMRWISNDRFRPSMIGPEQGSDGYILFRTIDLRVHGIVSLHQGDRFIAYGVGSNRMLLNVFITHIRPMGHYPDQGGPSLIKAFFKDRQPAKAAGLGMIE